MSAKFFGRHPLSRNHALQIARGPQRPHPLRQGQRHASGENHQSRDENSTLTIFSFPVRHHQSRTFATGSPLSGNPGPAGTPDTTGSTNRPGQSTTATPTPASSPTHSTSAPFPTLAAQPTPPNPLSEKID